MISKGKHPKLIRINNKVGAIYDHMDTYGHIVMKSFNCPTCDKRCNKGDEVAKGGFLNRNNSWFIRHKLYCCENCIPKEIKSK